MHTPELLLRVDRVGKHFGQHPVLQDVSLTIACGEIVGLAGESGSGKSTLARCIAGLQSRDRGDIYCRDRLLPLRYRRADFVAQAHDIQMIFQDPLSSLNPRLTIGDILCEPLALNSRLSRQQQQQAATDWLVRIGLQADDLSRYPHSFSGGQLQRIGIARALINRPALLICDEPISALDVSVQAQIVNLLLDLREEMGLAMLFIGHDLAMMRYLCDRILVLEQGRIVEAGSSASVLDNPQHAYTRRLVAAHPQLPEPRPQQVPA